MALSASTLYASSVRAGAEAFRAGNGVQFYAGALVGIDTGGATVASGHAAKWADTAGFRFVGLAQRDVLGNTGASPVPEVEVNTSGPTLARISVTGVSGVAHVSQYVYATDDGTYTLTPTANVKAVGMVVRWHTGAVCDVRLFTPAEFVALN